jgi:tRNA uridine 5-carbamoylmethylation protein Kti12
MHSRKTTIINLYGGPGTGKSTSAAYLYYILKAEGHNVELVREYVKDWAWEGRQISTYDQIYFLGKQVRRESLLYGKVDWIITDSPVMMNL